MRLSRRGGVVLVAALLAAAGTARLGVWQLDRAGQKLALQAALQSRADLPALRAAELGARADTAAAQDHRAVVLEGRWSVAHTVFLDNRQMNGRPGFYAVTPLLLADGRAVLVQRGWWPRDMQERTRVAAPPPPPGAVTVHGHMALAFPRLFEFAGAASGPIRQNLAIDAYARETGLPLLPLAVVQDDGPAAPADGLQRQWPAPAADVHKHYGYAFQWFAMSALIIGLYVWFQLVSPRFRRRRA